MAQAIKLSAFGVALYAAYLWGLMPYVVFLAALLFLVGVHELGHFLGAKLTGMTVSTFSIGFGPEIVGFNFRGVRYRLAIFPLGGYVKILGMIDEPQLLQTELEKVKEAGWSDEEMKRFSDESGWYCRKNGWAQALTIFLGPLFSLLLAIPLMMGGMLLQSSNDPAFMIQATMPENRAIEPGPNRIVGVPQNQARAAEDVPMRLHYSMDESTKLRVLHNKVDEAVHSSHTNRSEAKSEVIVANTLGDSIKGAWDMLVFHLKTLGWLATGKVSTGDLAGPVGVINIGQQFAAMGPASLCMFMAFLTSWLGVFNLLPLLPLDGGHLVMAVIKIFTGRSVSARVQTVVTLVGVALMFGLMALGMYNDIGRLMTGG